MTLDRQTLETRWLDGERPPFRFFWGHRPSRDGRVSASCFSQWWPATFDVDGVSYATAEHWMMAGKARLFGDDDIARQVLASTTPKDAKQLGRKIRGFDPVLWDRHKLDLVTEGNRHKFGQNEPLAAYLLATDEDVLVEASPVDPIWGIGLAADDPRASDPTQWEGENLLGFALMKVRSDLRG